MKLHLRFVGVSVLTIHQMFGLTISKALVVDRKKKNKIK